MERIASLGIKRLICMHDECYGAFTSLAPAYGMEVPFEPVHYFDYLYERMQALKDAITPLGFRVAYQRPCSSRLSPDKYDRVDDLFQLIGVECVPRRYEGENALCCGEPIRMSDFFETANDVQHRNIADMAAHAAEYCVFNCPACQLSLAEKLSKRGIQSIHMVQLCRMAIGEINAAGEEK